MRNDWQWVDRRCLQELGRQASHADGSVLKVAEGEQNGQTLCDILLPPMELRMGKHPLILDTPSRVRIGRNSHGGLTLFCPAVEYSLVRSAGFAPEKIGVDIWQPGISQH
jgi:hypothetical protein